MYLKEVMLNMVETLNFFSEINQTYFRMEKMKQEFV